VAEATKGYLGREAKARLGARPPVGRDRLVDGPHLDSTGPTGSERRASVRATWKDFGRAAVGERNTWTALARGYDKAMSVRLTVDVPDAVVGPDVKPRIRDRVLAEAVPL